MIRRSTKVAFELVAGLIAGVALLAGIAAWRLSAGPISLDFLRPYVERALSGDDGEITVEVARAELAWQGADHALVVRAGDVRARAADGRVVATVPALSVRVSGRALLRGLVAPTEISVLGPSVRLVRTVADNIELALAAGGPGEPAPAPDAGTGGGAVAAFLARELLAPLDDRRALGYLRRVQFLDGSLTLEDHLSGRMLRAPSADIRLTRDEAGIRAGLALALDLAGQLPRVDGDLLYRPGADSIDIAVSFNDIEPAWLKAEAPVMALFNRARLPVSGIVSLRLNAMLEPQILRFDLNGGRGQLAIPEFYDDALAVDRVEARGL
ncbi:MAG: hypothetical protein FJX52_11325, partial [Alphaproteobacteria bacterium]|nr:hypothetical protein [Alphaproteobacteria bacterium]